MRKLKIQQHKIEQVSFRLQRRDRTLFQTCIRTLKNNSKDRATMLANEIAEIKKLITFLHHVELAIERVFIRLETIRELSDIIIDLKPALRMLQSVSKQLFEVLPDVSSQLAEVNDVIGETLQLTRITADESLIPVGRMTPGGEKIIEEVTCVLEQKIAEKLPEPPVTLKTLEEAPTRQMVALSATCSQAICRETIETEAVRSPDLSSFKETEVRKISVKVEKSSLESILLKYVTESKGEVDLMQCSVELNTSYSEVEKALQDLGDKGKIVVKTKGR